MMRSSRILVCCAALLVLVSLSACGEMTDQIDLRIVRPDRDTLVGADVLRISVLDESFAQVVPALELSPASGASGDFSKLLPPQGTVRFLVEALAGNTVVARGGTAFVTLGAGDLSLSVVVGRVGTFHDTLDPEGRASPLPFPLAGATATRLKDGRVLIVGGASLDGAGAITDISKRVLLYDPNQGIFIPLATELRIRRAFHSATLLKASVPGGPQRVLIAGGITLIGGERLEATRLAEIFDPESGTFTVQLLEMQRARYGHSATLLVSGDVLVAGGGDLAPNQLLSSGIGPEGIAVGTVHGDADVFRFSDTAPRFATQTAAMAQARIFHGAGRGSGGLVLVAGGEGPAGAHSSTEVYVPDVGPSGTFQSGVNLVEPRTRATLTRLGNGTLLLVGGLTTRGSSTSASIRVERYLLGDSLPGEVSDAPVGSRLSAKRYAHQAVLLADNQRVLVVGGLGENGFTLQSAEILGPEMPTEVIAEAGERVYHDAVRLLSTNVLVMGGVARPSSGGVQPRLTGAIFVPALVGD